VPSLAATPLVTTAWQPEVRRISMPDSGNGTDGMNA
jgi:hypothetical protein